MLFNLSAMANPARISNDKDAVIQKEATKHKENNATVKKKKKIDITVEKRTDTDDKSTNWQGYSSEKEKYAPKEQENNSKYK